MKKYQDIVFMQESDADEAMRILNDQGIQAVADYLKQWDYGENSGEIYDADPSGTMDYIEEIDGYLLTINYGLPYVGLAKIIE